MNGKKKSTLIYLLSLILVGVFAIGFVTSMGFLNYRSTAIELEEKVIARVETDTVSGMETAVTFGKSFENYYGVEDLFASFREQFPGPTPFIITKDGALLYWSEEDGDDTGARVQNYLSSDEFSRELPQLSDKLGGVISVGRQRAVFQPIRQDDDVVGYFGSIYTTAIFDESFEKLIPMIVQEVLFFALLLCIAIMIFVTVVRSQTWMATHRRKSDRTLEKAVSVGILAAVILLLTAVSINTYQKDYRSRVEDSARISLQSLETSLSQVQNQGVNLREVDGLREYITDRVASLDTLHTIRVTERISEVQRTDEKSNLLSFSFDTGEGGEALYLEAEISDAAIARELRTIVLVLLSTMIILMIFVFEMNNLVELWNTGFSAPEKDTALPERQISLALRFTGFLCGTAECMCVPYAAMMIRASGESLFGLSIGMTSALPLTLEGFTQMIGMLLLPRVVRKFDVRKVLLASTIMMIACNVSAFWFGGALVIVVCRGIAGIAYSGFKQVSNYLITRGYETEKGRSDNISQDNAGLLAGSTCGAGLGAILSANAGYAVTFLCSAIVFAFYLFFTFSLVPWGALEQRTAQEEEARPIQMKGIVKMLLSPEMLFFVLAVGIPLNIGVMLCVTLVPAISQIQGISSVMLSYCYIANGIAGIYVGPALVSAAKARFGLRPCIAFTLGLTALGIFILRIQPVLLMLVLTSMILGFLDGFGTPMVTDQFMSLRVVEKEVDESTSLIFYVVLSYVLLMFAPMVAELLLLPGKGAFSPMLIGAILYAVAAVLVLIVRTRKGEKTQELSAK